MLVNDANAKLECVAKFYYLGDILVIKILFLSTNMHANDAAA